MSIKACVGRKGGRLKKYLLCVYHDPVHLTLLCSFYHALLCYQIRPTWLRHYRPHGQRGSGFDGWSLFWKPFCYMRCDCICQTLQPCIPSAHVIVLRNHSPRNSASPLLDLLQDTNIVVESDDRSQE